MGKAFENKEGGEGGKPLPDSFDINGYDPEAPDSDDEPLSDIEI